MDVHHIAEVRKGYVAVHQSGNLLNHVCGVRAEDVCSYNAVRLVSKDFDEPFGCFCGQSLTVGAIDCFVNGERLVFSRADAGCLWMGEYSCRHNVKTDVVLDAEDVIHGPQSLIGRGVSQHLSSVDITYGIDVRGGLESLWVDHYAAAVGLDVRGFQIQPFDICGAACSHQNQVGFDR